MLKSLSIYGPALGLVILMAILAICVDWYLDIIWFYIYGTQLIAASSAALIAILCLIFFRVAQFARRRIDHPLRRVGQEILNTERLVALSIPVVAAPLFLAGFTTVKSSMVNIVGFRWDPFLTDVDHAVFGVDPWIITHRLFSSITPALDWLYASWAIVLVGAQVGVALLCRPATNARFHFAMFSTWLLGGIVLAYCLSSAGPCFADLISADLAHRFSGLRAAFETENSGRSIVFLAQDYLRSSHASHVISRGSGISAMPSMHVAATAIYVFAAWSVPVLRWVAVAFSLLIWIGSIHFGLHYAMDGVVGYAVAGLCWAVSGSWALPAICLSREPFAKLTPATLGNDGRYLETRREPGSDM